jgi:hypothetical protein
MKKGSLVGTDSARATMESKTTERMARASWSASRARETCSSARRPILRGAVSLV